MTAPASTEAFAMPTLDRGWLDQHQPVPPPGPQPPQKQPKQTVSWANAPTRTREDAELVAQGKRLKQEVSIRVALAARPAAPVLKPPRIAFRVPSGDASVNGFYPDRILARHTHQLISFSSITALE